MTEIVQLLITGLQWAIKKNEAGVKFSLLIK